MGMGRETRPEEAENRAGVEHALYAFSAEACNHYPRGDIKAFERAVTRVEAETARDHVGQGTQMYLPQY